MQQGDYVLVTMGAPPGAAVHAVARVDVGVAPLVGESRDGTLALDVCLGRAHIPQLYTAGEVEPLGDVAPHGFCPTCKGWGLTSIDPDAAVADMLDGNGGNVCVECHGSGRPFVTVAVERPNPGEQLATVQYDIAAAEALECDICRKSFLPT